MKRRVLLLSAHVLSVFVIFRLLSVPAAEFVRKANSPENLGLAVYITPDNARNYYLLGLTSHYNLLKPNTGMAIQHYRTALSKNPLYSQAWYHLAKAYQSVNMTEDSLSAIENFYSLNTQNPEGIWDTGVFHLVESGRMEKAVTYFRRYIDIRPESQTRIYDIYLRMNAPNNYVIGNLLAGKTSFYPGYLEYLIKHGMVDNALDFWNNTDHHYFDEQRRLGFCDFLIASRRYDNAVALWEEMSGDARSPFERETLSNGNFENDIKNRCFDWVMGKAEGVDIYIDESIHSDGYRSLGITFDGNHNVDVTAIKQHVPLEPASAYVLTADIKTDDITTTNGLFFEATGHDCSGLHETSEMVTGTSPWRTITMRFSVPPGCRVVDISLRRQKSGKFNNRIKGTAWVDGVELHKAEP